MTTNTTPAVDAMIDGRRADSTRRRQRVLSVLDTAIKEAQNSASPASLATE
jgi:hypothetical protein